MAELEKGDRAPAFELEGSDGKTHCLCDHAGVRAVVIAWFPKAGTPCTSRKLHRRRFREHMRYGFMDEMMW